MSSPSPHLESLLTEENLRRHSIAEDTEAAASHWRSPRRQTSTEQSRKPPGSPALSVRSNASMRSVRSQGSLAGMEDRKAFVASKRSKLYHKMKYYSKLSHKDDLRLAVPPTSVLPAYVLPTNIFIAYEEDAGGEATQSSITTIFSIWNTMMGSSLLSMPWGFQQAGFTGGLLVMCAMGFVCFYTCLLILNMGTKGGYADLFQICVDYLGRQGQFVTWVAALLLMVGALMAYNILIADSLYNSVVGIHAVVSDDTTLDGSDIEWWTHGLVCGILAAVLLVLTSVKELTVFVKMNSVGLVFVAYICSFILYKSYEDPSQIHFELEAPELSLGMAQFGGVMVLSFFVHSAIMSIMKNQKQPEHNGRDLTIAYMLVGLTYALIGGSAYIRFNHEELPQDFLNLFPQNDVTAVIARICLLLQLMTVFPLILYVVRIQFFGYLFNKQYPGRTQVVLLNGTILLCTTLITLYYPKVGDIQRYTGAICGFILIFLMPTSLYISSNYHSLVSFLPYPLFKIQTVNVNSPPQQQQQQQQQQQPRKQPSRSQSHSRSAGVEPARQESWGRPVQEESSTISLLSEDHLLSGEVEGNLQQEPVDKSVQSPAEMVDVAAHLLLIVMGLGLAIFNFV